jgi:hypothetical protein
MYDECGSSSATMPLMPPSTEPSAIDRIDVLVLDPHRAPRAS